MNETTKRHHPAILMQAMLILAGFSPAILHGQTITPSSYWKNQVLFPDDAFCSYPSGGATWMKFTILLEPYDPNLVYFQNSKIYKLHYDFATKELDPFKGMTVQQFNAALSVENPPALLGTVLFPPVHGTPSVADYSEYGIQFVRYNKEQIRDFFFQVKAGVTASPGVQALFFPTFEQEAVTEADRAWFESQGIRIGSLARWAKDNTCYSEGWALGRLKYFTSDRINQAYQAGDLEPNDILLTDGVPAEIPLTAGVISLASSTPNSHVAILCRTYASPFVHAALQANADLAKGLVGHRILFSAYEDAAGTCETRITDTEGLLDDAFVAEILKLKQTKPLRITPMTPYGTYGVPTDGLLPSDVRYVGGKAANFGILRAAVPDNSPKALALTFDLWNAFLDQPLAPVQRLDLEPGGHVLFWADEDVEQGPTHAGFKLSKSGESVALFNVDRETPLDAVSFGPQQSDVSYGRPTDGSDTWKLFTSPTPGQPNSKDSPVKGPGVVINEIMADNKSILQDPNEPSQYPDWIELYNTSDQTCLLNGLYLTDDVNKPTLWQIPPNVGGGTLRQEIASRLSKYRSASTAEGEGLSRDLAAIRSLFTQTGITRFSDSMRTAVLAVLTDPNYGFDPNANLRFRSSTNVEDSDDYTGAGLYDSFGGCLADELDGDDRGPCGCDPNKSEEDGVFHAIRQTFASFYNDNAYLERLRRDVNEAQVGMALLVHPSFPDEIELANGVATLAKRPPDPNTYITLVSQLGAVSVTNPEDGSIPEEVMLRVRNGTVYGVRDDGRDTALNPKSLYGLQRNSSLVPLGGLVMAWINDYKALANLLLQVSNQYSLVTGRSSYILDIEYKKVAQGDKTLPSGGLVIKQVRPLPEPNQTTPITPFLIQGSMEFEVFPGEREHLERTDVFADHRLKSRWRLETQNMALDANTLITRGLYGQITVEYLDEDRVLTKKEPMPAFAQHGLDGTTASDTWRWTDLANPRVCHLLTTGVPTAVPAAANPILTLADLGTDAYTPYRVLTLNVTYDNPVMAWYQDPRRSYLSTTTSNLVYLWPCSSPSPEDILQERAFAADGISIKTSFYYPPPPEGYNTWDGSTAPLKRWKQTVIEGLTTTPIVLEGYWSQTCRPEFHNTAENFLFEPRLEPGISSDLLDQLRAKDVRFIHLFVDHTGGTPSKILTHGFNASG